MASSRREVKQRKKKAGKAKSLRVIASILIIVGVGVVAYFGYEQYMVRHQQAKLREAYEASAGFSHIDQLEQKPEEVFITEWQPMRLIIPSIDVDLIAVGGGDVFDHALLDQGPTHFQMSDLPNTERGNVAFAGHRAGRWNFFLEIDKLDDGDEIYLDVDGYRFIYLVEWVIVTDKYDWDPIDPTDYPAITLQTCEPVGVPNPDWRLFVRGKLDEVIYIPVETPDAN